MGIEDRPPTQTELAIMRAVLAEPLDQGAWGMSSGLVYVPGQNAASNVAIKWLDRAGATTDLRTASGNWSNPHFSPDGQRLFSARRPSR